MASWLPNISEAQWIDDVAIETTTTNESNIVVSFMQPIFVNNSFMGVFGAVRYSLNVSNIAGCYCIKNFTIFKGRSRSLNELRFSSEK